MKRWKRILAFALCLSLICIAGLQPAGTLAVKAAGKSGLLKEGGKYYYYSNDTKLVNKWKNIKVKSGGETVKQRFYFGSDGAAYCGKKNSDGTLVLAKKKIDGKVYGFDHLCHMLKGVCFSKGKFFVFDSTTGVLDKQTTKKLRAAAKEGTAYETLINLLVTLGSRPQEIRQNLETNYGNGTGNIYSYDGFEVHVFKDAATGKMTVMTVMAKPLSDSDTQQGESGTEGDSPDATLRKVNGKYYCYNSSGEAAVNEWKTIKGYRYYFGADGSAKTGSAKIDGKLYLFNAKGRLMTGTKSRFETVAKKRYYVDKDGSPYTGWMVIENALYYANGKGVIKRNKKSSEGITFDSNGKAQSGTAANLKITTMQIVASITNNKMTKEQKLKACWDYMVGGQRFTYYLRTPDFTKKGWQKEEALNMFNTRAGSSYGFACAFAALASQVGYSPFVVAGRVSSKSTTTEDGLTPHCWVIINQKYYDPCAQFRGWWKGVYGLASYDIRNVIQYKVDFNKSV